MKNKIFIFILTIILACLLFACDSSKENPVSQPIINAALSNGKLVAYQGVQQENDLTFSNAINIDNEYFFYYFYLGTISKVPLYTSVALQYQYDTEVTFSFNKLTSESLSNSVSKSTATVDTHSYTGGFKVGFSQEFSAKAGVLLAKAKATFSAAEETDHHWTNNWGSTTTDSKTTTSAYLTQYSNGYMEKVVFSNNAGFTKGHYYRISFYDVVSAYGVLAYDVKSNIYSTTNDFFLESNSTARVWEESLDPVFTYEQHKDLNFDVDKAIEYAEKHKLELISTEKSDVFTPSTYYVSTKPLSCRLDNKYNYDDPDPNGNKNHYSHNFDFGCFVISGCAKSDTTKDTYKLVNNTNVKMSFRLEYDADSLPIQDTMTSRRVNSDSKQSGFYKLPWDVGQRNVQKGMIVALIEYNDGTPSDKICITNAFDNVKGGGCVTIADGVCKPCKVSIAICYELVQWAPGFLGISDDYWMNWRINQTFYLVW